MDRANICTKKTFKSKGEEKTRWNQVGTLTELDDGTRILELFMYPETRFYVFNQEQKEAPKAPTPIRRK